MVGQFNKSKHPDKITVALHFVDFAGDEFAKWIFISRNQSILMVNE